MENRPADLDVALLAIAHRGPDSRPGLLSVRCDVTSAGQVDAAFRQIESEHGPVEVLVANAGTIDDAPLALLDEEQFVRVLDTNLIGAYRVAKRACRPMVRARWGRMVFVSSVLAANGCPGAANYSASKAGLIGLARSIAREYARYGITSNLVSPGLVNTDLVPDMHPAQRDGLISRTLLERPAEPHEIASAVTWLASMDACYVTGADIPVDGGLGLGA